MATPFQRVRIFLSLCAATAGSLIAQHQHHFTLSLADPHTFVIMTQHRCGRLFMVTILWMSFETLLALTAALRPTAAPEAKQSLQPE